MHAYWVDQTRSGSLVTDWKLTVTGFDEWSAGDSDRSSLWNFMQEDPRFDLPLMTAVSSVIWPEFVVRKDCVLLLENSDEDDFIRWSELEPTDVVEWQLNHVHISDFTSGVHVSDELAAFVVATLQKTWNAKLALEFPERTFIVEVAEVGKDASISFRQVRP